MKSERLVFALLMFSATLVRADGDKRMTFEGFLKMALGQNLNLKAEKEKSSAAHAAAEGVAIPPPMVGYMRTTDAAGSSASGIEVSQMVPFPAKLAHDHSARRFEAEAQEESALAAESEARAEAKLHYFNLWASQQKHHLLLERKSAIQEHLRLSRAGARSDSFLRIHLLKVESDLDLLENDILASEQDVREKQLSMAEFLNSDPSNLQFNLDEPPIETPNGQKAPAASHQLESARLTLESFKEREGEAKSSWFPDLYLRYRNFGQTQMMPGSSEIMVGISLPFLFPWEPSAAADRATAQRLESEARYQSERVKGANRQTVLLGKAASLKKQIENISQKLLPRAEKRMNLVHNIAPRDMESLQDHREAMEAFPDLKLKALELRSRYEESLAEWKKHQRGSAR